MLKVTETVSDHSEEWMTNPNALSEKLVGAFCGSGRITGNPEVSDRNVCIADQPNTTGPCGVYQD